MQFGTKASSNAAHKAQLVLFQKLLLSQIIPLSTIHKEDKQAQNGFACLLLNKVLGKNIKILHDWESGVC